MSRSRFGFIATLLLSFTAGRAAFAGINFAGAETIPVAAKPEFMLAGDLNGDGSDDVVVIAPRSREVDIYLGNGSAASNFMPGGAIHFGQKLAAGAIGDLNNDKIPDVVVTDSSDASVWILLGNGDGTFLAPYEVLVDGSKKPIAVAIGNFDNNGYDDLAVADEAGTVFILRNDNGTPPKFLKGGNIPVGTAGNGGGLADIRSADLNDDGHLDLVILNLGGPRVKEIDTVLWTGVTQGFPNFSTPQAYTIGVKPSSMIVADFNSDMFPDVATLNLPVGGTGDSEIDILLNDTHGGLSLPEAVPLPCPFATGGAHCGGQQLAAADFDGNGTIDLVATLTDPRSGLTDAMQAFGGRGDGAFFPGGVFTVGNSPLSIAVGDFNRDAKSDVAIANATLTLQAFLNFSSAGNLQDGASCLLDDVCLSNRCTDGVCCAAACDLNNNEVCNVPRREGDCVAIPLAPKACTVSSSTCLCIDGFCCDQQCPGGQCNAPGYEGVCIPGIPTGQACPSGNNADCTSGFCSVNQVCCNSECTSGFCDSLGVCHGLSDNGTPCQSNSECSSNICDPYNAICCNTRCDPNTENCNEQGICQQFTPGPGTPNAGSPGATATATVSATPRSTPVQFGACSVSADCTSGNCAGNCCASKTPCASGECTSDFGVCVAAATPTVTPTPGSGTPGSGASPTPINTRLTCDPNPCPAGQRCELDPFGAPICIGGGGGGGGCSASVDEPARGNLIVAALLPLALWAGRRLRLRRARVGIRLRTPRQ
jgi:hypothetical protein